MSANSNYGTLRATTLDAWLRTKLSDNLFDRHPLLALMNKKGKKVQEDGGAKLLEPLLYGRSTNVVWSGGYTPVPTTQQSGIDVAEFGWKELVGAISISDREKNQNSGRSAILNLFQSKTMQLTMTMDDELSTQLFGDGTGEDGLVLTGLKAIVNNSGTLGNISRADHAWWKAYVEDTEKPIDEGDLSSLRIGANRGGGQGIDIYVCSPTLWQSLEATIRPAYRTSDPTMASLGFDSLQIGTVPLVYDHACDDDRLYGLNTEFLKLRSHKDADMEVYPTVTPHDQTVEVTKVRWMGNVTCGNCRNLGVLTNRS